MAEQEKIVLSIQSHVTHGYVGNKAATFPLQLHGFDVDAVNTVSLSNHSGYPVIKGHRMDLEEYETILAGLEANQFLPLYRYILTGYINNDAVVRHVQHTVATVKQVRAAGAVTYICDPVLGDDGRLYCRPEVVDAYRAILACADIATPNYFEAELLSGVHVADLASAAAAADYFHAQGTRIVVVKSFPDKTAEAGARRLRFLISVREGEAARRRYTGTVPYHEGQYTGTGDVFAASLLAFYHAHGEAHIDVVVAKAMGVVQDLILATRRTGGVGGTSLNSRELRVTSSPDSLLHPQTVVTVVPVAEADLGAY
ncbi:pyridoxine kinase [Strigomonas culicis]|uniref:pyridoxal kinase n=1 Tax=Strigomonas culicis TaxID=28005 RepID=S9VM32_9TRYP|nr:pyridoxal kinase [Strigomonas culicis]EPY24270.1 pyridoxine kinase [Strigomonas culicis]|eukprot:EPY24270.1 pyridoxine kinase [Strigomonas culicis]